MQHFGRRVKTPSPRARRSSRAQDVVLCSSRRCRSARASRTPSPAPPRSLPSPMLRRVRFRQKLFSHKCSASPPPRRASPQRCDRRGARRHNRRLRHSARDCPQAPEGRLREDGDLAASRNRYPARPPLTALTRTASHRRFTRLRRHLHQHQLGVASRSPPSRDLRYLPGARTFLGVSRRPTARR